MVAQSFYLLYLGCNFYALTSCYGNVNKWSELELKIFKMMQIEAMKLRYNYIRGSRCLVYKLKFFLYLTGLVYGFMVSKVNR